MVNHDELIDLCVQLLQSNPDFVAAMDNADPENILPYYHEDAGGTNFEQFIQTQPKGTALLAWRGTRTGRFGNAEATKHDFALFLKPIGRASGMIAALFSGLCVFPGAPFNLPAPGRSFRKCTVHPRCYPPHDTLAVIPSPIFVGQPFQLYDTLPATFTLTEKGLDV